MGNPRRKLTPSVIDICERVKLNVRHLRTFRGYFSSGGGLGGRRQAWGRRPPVEMEGMAGSGSSALIHLEADIHATEGNRNGWERRSLPLIERRNEVSVTLHPPSSKESACPARECCLKIQEVLETEPVIVIRPITAYEPMPE
jgi:Fe2+ transport protein